MDKSIKVFGALHGVQGSCFLCIFVTGSLSKIASHTNEMVRLCVSGVSIRVFARRAHNPEVAGSSPASATTSKRQSLEFQAVGAFRFRKLACKWRVTTFCTQKPPESRVLPRGPDRGGLVRYCTTS